MLILRLITALILIPIVILSLFSLSITKFTVIIFFISILAAWEWSYFLGLSSSFFKVIFTVSCGVILLGCMVGVLSNFQYVALSLSHNNIVWVSLFWWLIAMLLVYYYPHSAFFWRHSCMLRVLFGFMIIFSFFCGMLNIRQYNYDIDHNIGIWQLLYLLCLVWGADSGAYLFGKRFGNHQLVPKLSPGKTWEGFWGGLLTSLVICFLFSEFVLIKKSLILMFFLSIIVFLASVLGDLSESMFKREASIKDSGNLLPGHGGILDRIDSLTAAAPVFASLQWLI
ncbi:phosphatidate cytidylyltransferase [Candidatus Erwinia haradaeae]|uniref:Phosphatidate cytidylyltransferase n=1 Tax=Candidatus Erwinia haradaeae TaxID=1922217 RepID=A0A451D1Y9_9GAMM|nr:phosphatidate cytidylyltransferase [Candidatus Erwinia haradaeae]VFP79641.1 Phosphatidate cytidylyltransferase [Candidatus Erwinia haradaeae]